MRTRGSVRSARCFIYWILLIENLEYPPFSLLVSENMECYNKDSVKIDIRRTELCRWNSYKKI